MRESETLSSSPLVRNGYIGIKTEARGGYDCVDDNFGRTLSYRPPAQAPQITPALGSAFISHDGPLGSKPPFRKCGEHFRFAPASGGKRTFPSHAQGRFCCKSH